MTGTSTNSIVTSTVMMTFQKESIEEDMTRFLNVLSDAVMNGKTILSSGINATYVTGYGIIRDGWAIIQERVSDA